MIDRTVLQDALQRAVDIMQSTEDSDAIREIIREAGIAPGVYVGDPPESFRGNPEKTTEYVLGQWADGIDGGTAFLNTFRNVTLAWAEEGKLLPVTIPEFEKPKAQ